MDKKIIITSLVIVPLLSLGTVKAADMDATRDSSVAERSRDDYQPLGIKIGGFKLWPSFEIENEWNDNIFQSQTEVIDDFVFHLRPSVNVISEWSVHELAFSAGADVAQYVTNDDENKEDYSFNVSGRFDILKDSFTQSYISYAKAYEDRGSPDSVAGSIEPTEYQTFSGGVLLEHKTNRLRFSLFNDFNYTQYKNGRSQLIDIINDGRNRWDNRSTARVGYEINPGYEAYVSGSYNFVDYDRLTSGTERSSDGYEFSAGVALDFTGKLVGDFYIGFREQLFDSSVLDTIGDITGGISLQWMPTGLTTVNVGLDRSIQETTQGTSPGSFVTALSASVDHELLRNLLLNASVGYTYTEFEAGDEREDDSYNAGLSAKYLFNRNVFAKMGYEFSTRNATANTALTSDFDVHSIFLTLGTQL